ncbi:MAG: HAMP domain-containing sensor histidine kinase [Gammaproteobacteria bacterium]
MTTERRRRLNASLWRAFVLQIVLISATAVAGVFLAEFAIRELLIVSALEREADYFWARRKISADTPAPNTNALIGYVFERNPRAIPEEFEALELGIHDVVTPIGRAVVHVSEDPKGRLRLYLVFDANNVKELATYFGIAPLALMLVVLYCSAWVAYRITRRAVSPVIRLARNVREIDLETADKTGFESVDLDRSDEEIEVLTRALDHLLGRVNRFVERERTFTREASHELRSPLTVVRMASDNLLNRHVLEPVARSQVEKIRRAALDMQELTEILLLLARENDGKLVTERVVVNEILTQEMNRCRMLFEHKKLEWVFEDTHRLVVENSPRVVAIVFGNLLRNAGSYTDCGRIEVHIEGVRVLIRDTGRGMSREHLGEIFTPVLNRQHAQGNGIGLSLVKRITERFDWSIEISSEPERGTSVWVTLSDALVQPYSAAGAVREEASRGK